MSRFSALLLLSRYLRSISQRTPPMARQTARCRPAVECLENRLAPALLSGAVTGGNGIFSLFSFSSGAAGTVSAANAGNDFQATVLFNAGAGGAALNDTNSILFGNAVSAGPVAVTSAGSVTQLPGTG